jgi:hypothetical protein
MPVPPTVNAFALSYVRLESRHSMAALKLIREEEETRVIIVRNGSRRGDPVGWMQMCRALFLSVRTRISSMRLVCFPMPRLLAAVGIIWCG